MIFFDLDGPILDVSRKYYRVYSTVVRELNGIPLTQDCYWQRKRERDQDTAILRDSQVPESKLQEFRDRRRALIETADYWQYDTAWPEVQAVLTGLPQPPPIVVVTLRNQPHALHAELRALGLDRLFAKVLSVSGDAGHGDRHEAKVALVRDQFGRLRDGWFVGDTETDLRAGEALGLARLAVTFGIRTEALLQRENPNFIARSPAELAHWLAEQALCT
ncbi:MAG: HAD family hydrolase [Opitutaceae bacterium]|nr:HAD family hydrolase [Opitutaceae bacterium]